MSRRPLRGIGQLRSTIGGGRNRERNVMEDRFRDRECFDGAFKAGRKKERGRMRQARSVAIS